MATSDDNSTEELFSFDVVVKYDDTTPAIGSKVRVHANLLNTPGPKVTVYADPEGKLPFPDHLSPDPELGLVQGYLPEGEYLLVITPVRGYRRTIMPLYVPERKSMELSSE